MPRPTVRHHILDHIRRHQDVSAAQIGRALGLKPPSVRHHLGILARDGRIALTGGRHPGARGRPTHLYRLSEQMRGDNLSGLAESILDAAAKLPVRGREQLLSGVVSDLILQVGPVGAEASGTRRLAALVSRLDPLHYEASWEAGAFGPRVIFGHCPYAAIIERHPELCQIDARMLSGELNSAVEQTARIETKPGGQARCIFAVG